MLITLIMKNLVITTYTCRFFKSFFACFEKIPVLFAIDNQQNYPFILFDQNLLQLFHQNYFCHFH